MFRLDEITRAIIEHEVENFGTEFSLSEIRDLNHNIEYNFDDFGYNYFEPTNTKYTYLVLDKDEIDDIWSDSLRDLFDDCYAHDIPEHIRNYIDYESWIEDCKEDGRPHHFNGYDGETEIETDNYYIYYHNMNYK